MSRFFYKVRKTFASKTPSDKLIAFWHKTSVIFVSPDHFLLKIDKKCRFCRCCL